MTQKVSTNCLLFYPRTELCFSYSKVCSRRCWFCNLKEVITELNVFWSAIFLFSSFTCKRHIHFCLLLQNIIFFFLSRIFIPIQQQPKKWSVLHHSLYCQETLFTYFRLSWSLSHIKTCVFQSTFFKSWHLSVS